MSDRLYDVRRTDAPWQLGEDQRTQIKEWTLELYPQYEDKLGLMWGQCRDWYLAQGLRQADWGAVFRRWISTQHKIDSGQKYQEQLVRELPVERKPRGSGVIDLADAVNQLKKKERGA